MTHTLKIMKVRMRYHLELNLGKTVSPRRVIRRSFLTYQKMTLMMRKMKFLCKRTQLNEQQNHLLINQTRTPKINKMHNKDSNNLQEIHRLEVLRNLFNKQKRNKRKMKRQKERTTNLIMSPRSEDILSQETTKIKTLRVVNRSQRS